MHTNPYYGLHGLRPRAATPQSPPVAEPAPAAEDELMFDELDGEARMLEWTGGPAGRRGRELLAEIERYLAFFAIARSDA